MVKILIVDDSSFARQRLRLMFEMQGHEVVGLAGDGDEALAQYKKFKPDVVTLDHLMTGKNGEQVLGDLLKFDPDVKVIMVSGSGDHAIEERVIEAGAKAFVQKFNPQHSFLRAIEQVTAC